MGCEMKRLLAMLLALAAATLCGAVSAQAATSITIDGSYNYTVVRPDSGSRCPSGLGNECGVFQLAVLGPADYVYVYGSAFEPTGNRGCFYIDGTFTITLQSDGSSVSGLLSGVFCAPGNSGPSQEGKPSFGNSQSENDTILFSGGTGQFTGLQGTVSFSEFTAGARLTGILEGTLTG
jgi:hypothetical protein